jgi:cysteinyl-tRNA synthetase
VDTLREHARRLDPEGPEPEGQADRLERFLAALSDDFNTAAARGVLFEWVREANRRMDGGERMGPGRLPEMLHLLGLENVLAVEDAEGPGEEAQRLLDEREAARAARDFELADRRRDELAALGFEVRDTAEGPRLVRRA